MAAKKKTEIEYIPPQKYLKQYANVLVNFALGEGKGIKKGDVVVVRCPEVAKPLLLEIRKAIWQAGGHVLLDFMPDGDKRFADSVDMYQNASDAQIGFFPEKYVQGLFADADHVLAIVGDIDEESFTKAKIDPKRVAIRAAKFTRPYREVYFSKYLKGDLSWSLAIYGTQSMADQAGLSQEEYWDQLIKACYLTAKDPIKKWKETNKEVERIARKLTKMEIEKVHIEGENADLWLTIGGKTRSWKGGAGCNLPSYEIFTSPDCRFAEGWIKFDQPLYRPAGIMRDIYLEFKNGKVIKAKAKSGQKALDEIVNAKNGNRIGEFSLTDKRFSQITKPMANTLFDENMGGKYGNTHLALGMSYNDTYNGDHTKLSEKQLKELGFNASDVHDDIVATTDRTVTAYMKNGKEKVIYEDGMFQV